LLWNSRWASAATADQVAERRKIAHREDGIASGAFPRPETEKGPERVWLPGGLITQDVERRCGPIAHGESFVTAQWDGVQFVEPQHEGQTYQRRQDENPPHPEDSY
jgi:hypothetical protein